MSARWIAAARPSSRGPGRAPLRAFSLAVALLAAIAAGCGKAEESAAPAGGGTPAAGAPKAPGAGDALSPREITERVCGLVADQLRRDPKEVTPGTTLESLSAEDLDRSEILISCEAEFDIQLPDEAADAWRTVGDVITEVSRALDERK